MRAHVLQLDIQGTPQAWITPEQAALRYASDAVAWTLGEEPLITLRGGFNVQLRRQSVLEIAPIIALRGHAGVNLFDVVPTVTRSKLFARDRFTCGYCGRVFDRHQLQAEHIIPESRGGPWSWSNLISACASCNSYKGARLPEEAGMPLLFVPYVPSRYEDFLLQGRNIRVDVHAWLASRLPPHSRLH
jgi:hypothetical protein